MAYWTVLAACALFLAFGIDRSHASALLPDLPVVALTLRLAGEWYTAFGERVLAETLLSSLVRVNVRYAGLADLYLFLPPLYLLLAAWAYRGLAARDRWAAQAFLALQFVALAILAFNVFARGPEVTNAYAQRYSYVSAFLVVFSFAVLVVPILATARGRNLSLIGAALLLTITNIYDVRFYETQPEHGRNLQDLLAAFADETADGAGCARLERGLSWSFELREGAPDTPCREIAAYGHWDDIDRLNGLLE